MWSPGWVGIDVVTRVVADTWSPGWVGIHVVTRVNKYMWFGYVIRVVSLFSTLIILP